MKKGAKAKLAMLEAAIELLDEKGYFGMTTNELLARSGSPRGSLYYHFPGGKDEIVIAALALTGEKIGMLLQETFKTAQAPREAVEALFGLFSQRLEETDFACGCPISAVALECSGRDSVIGAACADVYREWQASFAAYLLSTSHSTEDTANDTASLLFSLLEGALLLARSMADLTPMHTAKRHCLQLVSTTTSTSATTTKTRT